MTIVPYTSIGDHRIGEWSGFDYDNLVNSAHSIKTGSFDGLVVVDKSKKIRLSFEGYNCVALDCYNPEVTLFEHKLLCLSLADTLSLISPPDHEILTDGDIVVLTDLGLVFYFEDLDNINVLPSMVGINDGKLGYESEWFMPLAEHFG